MKKSLIIYFSHTGENYMSDGIRPIQKGNTEVIAEMIEEITQAKMFKVEPIQDYPFSYKECTEIALYEKNTKTRPALKNDLTSVSDYDVIYLGYPNWWGTMPMPLFTLLEKLDLSNKVIKPFCTHEGSSMGSSLSDLKKLCSKSIIKEGISIRGSLVHDAKIDIEHWVFD